MKIKLSIKIFVAIILVLNGLSTPLLLTAQTSDIKITIHLRGVYDSKISLLALNQSQLFKPILVVEGIKNGDTASMTVPKKYLPGEFVLRFDYKEKESSTPYPSEKHIFIYNQDLELWVIPMYSNNADSTFFQADEKENNAFAWFSEENMMNKEKLGVLQNFLMNYDDTGSEFYQEGIKEYEKRRLSYNEWLAKRVETDKELFVSNLYGFQHVPQIPWKGTENDRVLSLIEHYFDGIDFSDSLIIKTSDINKWMDNYVNLYGQMVSTISLRDSLFSLAGISAIEEAKKGHPLVYGWMVDYFYRGYEANGLDAGIKILEPYMNDPSCLTSKRQEISRRLEGIETLVPGSGAPAISMTDPQGGLFNLCDYGTPGDYILILFWSADCDHCMEMVSALYPWQQQNDVINKLSVVAISLDETETEIAAWNQKIADFKSWKHLLAPEGVRSQVAYDYYILATPIMVLLDAKSKEIVALPGTLTELKKEVE